MSIIILGLDVTTNADGDTNRVVLPSRENYLIQVVGTGTFSCAIQISIDGTSWYAIATKTADEVFTIIDAPYIRLVTSGMSAASVTVRAQV